MSPFKGMHFTEKRVRIGLHIGIVIALVMTLVTRDPVKGMGAGIITFMGIGLNLDNVVILAPLCKGLPKWGKALFFSAGLLISIIFVQILLPVWIVSIVNHAGFSETLHAAIFKPVQYGTMQEHATLYINAAAFSFLGLMGLKHMFDPTKKVHWLKAIEPRLARLGVINELPQIIIGVMLIWMTAKAPTENRGWLAIVAFSAYVVFFIFDIAGKEIKEQSEAAQKRNAKMAWWQTLIQLFVILMLESVFCIDSLASAYAVTSDFLVIVVGLVASGVLMRLLLIGAADDTDLGKYRYLETSAYWAMIYLALCTYLAAFGHPLPELVVGLGSTAIIIAGGVHSHIENKRDAKKEAAAAAATVSDVEVVSDRV